MASGEEIMPKINLIEALREVVGEKNLSMGVLVEAIEEALVVAYKKNFDSDENVKVVLDEKTGSFNVIASWEVIDDDEPDDPEKQYSLKDAREIDPSLNPGDIIEEDVTPPEFGRIAAQTARQVVSQKLREAERNQVFEEYQNRVGEVLSGKVQRVEKGHVYVEFAKTEAVLPPWEQNPGEVFRTNDRIKCYIKEVKQTSKGPQIVLSRSASKFVEILFTQSVPEIEDGIVAIKSSSREPGLRVKISVSTSDPRVDPVGACVGLRGSRIKGIVDELNGEKIDIVRYSEDPVEYIINSLSPAKVSKVQVSEDKRSALAIVSQGQLSLAIGKEGQNVKLASRLTGIKIDIKTEQDIENMASAKTEED